MTRAQICRSLKISRRHLKKIIIVTSFLGIGIIIINVDEFFRENNCAIKTRDDETQNQLWMDIMAARMERRKKKLEENCKYFRLHVKGNDSLHRPNEWEFLINRPFHLVWCNVFKAASTSWMYNFNILAGYKAEFLQKTKEVPLQLARNKYPRPSLESLNAALNDSTSFLIVRHPLDRLLSGYRDKIEHALPNTYHYKLGNYIVKKYRIKADVKVSVHNLFDTVRARLLFPRSKPGKLSLFDYFKKNQRRPTFSEFVQFVIDLYLLGKPLDMHWTPVNTFCTPCQIRFDIIIKFETLQEDQTYLIQKTNLQSWIKPQWKNPTKGRKSTSKYYGQLNASQIYHLYELYMYDFHLFDYSLEDYLKYINSDKDGGVLGKLRFLFDLNKTHKKAIETV